jgi:hypothetical protein
MYVDLAVFYLDLEKGFARGLLLIPTTEESPNAESKIESPESGDYNPHRSARKRNLSENREYFQVRNKNKQQFAEPAQIACKILQTRMQQRRKKSPGESPMNAVKKPRRHSSSTSVSGS